MTRVTAPDSTEQAQDAPASDHKTLAGALQAELFARRLMLATAESLTGGQLGDVLSAAPGASDTYLGGVVSYATSVKQKVLGVSQETVDEHGVVSGRCAEEMAQGVRDLMGADWGVSTTGVAGPTEQEGKPVGLVFVGVAGDGLVRSRRHEFDGERAEIRAKATAAAMDLLVEALREAGGPEVRVAEVGSEAGSGE